MTQAFTSNCCSTVASVFLTPSRLLEDTSIFIPSRCRRSVPRSSLSPNLSLIKFLLWFVMPCDIHPFTAGGPGRCPNTGQTQYYVVHELPSFLEFFLVVIFFSLASRSSTSGTSSSTTIHYIARLFSSPTSRVVALTMLATLHRIKIVVVLFL